MSFTGDRDQNVEEDPGNLRRCGPLSALGLAPSYAER